MSHENRDSEATGPDREGTSRSDPESNVSDRGEGGADRRRVAGSDDARGNGADRAGRDADDKLVDTEPDREAIDEPTTDSEQASRETRWILQQGLAIGLVSIAGGLLIAFGLMQATGLVSLPGPLGGSAIAHWAVFVALGVLLLAAFAYSQRRP